MTLRKRKRKFTQAVKGDDDVLIEEEKKPIKRQKKVAWCNKIAIRGCDNLGEKIQITKFDARIENKPATTYEVEDSLRYQSAKMSASATVQMPPLDSQERWKVGFVQACTSNVSYSVYGEKGSTSWTYPQLASGQQVMMNDSYGDNYPFYGSSDESVVFKGPCDTYQEATVNMNDAPDCTNPWCFPDEGEPNLTNTFRKQSFNLWLIAQNLSSGQAFVLKGVSWNTLLDIDVDPTEPLGKRAHVTSDPVPKQPTELRDLSIPRCALMPPCCNNAQMLTWWPRDGKPQCLIEPE